MQLFTKKAYLLVEMLVVMWSLSILLSLCFFSLPSFSWEAPSFLQRYLQSQAEAIAKRKEKYVGEGIVINKRGNVRQGKTLFFGERKIVIRLGNGSFRYE